MNTTTIDTFVASSQLHDQLQSALFVVRERAALDVLNRVEACVQEILTIKNLCGRTKVSRTDAVELQHAADRLQSDIGMIVSEFEESRETLKAIEQVVATGSKLMQVDTFLTRMTEGFSFTGSRNYVNDGHFVRRRLHWLESPEVAKFETAVRELLFYGRSEPLDRSTTSEANTTVNSLQLILLYYGIAMSRSLPYAVFAEIPPIWNELITACQNMTQTLTVLHMIVKAKENLQLALAEMQAMLTEEMRLGSEPITFDSFFSTKPGIKKIRGVMVEFRAS